MNSKASPLNLRVPDDLREYDQWILWRRERSNGRETKVPYSVKGNRASSTNPDDWAEFTKALDIWHRYPQRYTGLGFVFCGNDPFVGLDLDDCLDVNGRLKPWAQGIIERFSDTYIEISPSGQGLKIWAKGDLPRNVAGVRVGDGQIEMYDCARYFTVTGGASTGLPLKSNITQQIFFCSMNGSQRQNMNPVGYCSLWKGDEFHTANNTTRSFPSSARFEPGESATKRSKHVCKS